MTSRRPWRVRLCGAVIAVAPFAASRAHADRPAPGAHCASDEPARQFDLTTRAWGSLASVTAVRDGESVVVVASVRSRDRGRHAETRVVAAELGADAGHAIEPTTVAVFPGRAVPIVALAAAGGRRRALLGVEGEARVVFWQAGEREAQSQTLPRPPHALRVEPVLAQTASGFALAWPEPRGALIQNVPLDESSSIDAPREIELPVRTRLVQAAAGPDGTLGLVIRTSANRFWIATVDAEGHRHWPNTAPAGCERNFCPSVRLLSSRDGFLATWFGRRTEEGLRSPSARRLDATGHAIGGATEFLPMVHGEVIAGPHGEPLAIQLGRPLILRGASAPIALTPPPDATREIPFAIAVWTMASPDAIELVAATRSGTVTFSRVHCTSSELARSGP